MTTVSYSRRFNYLYDLQNQRFPGLPLRISSPNHPEQELDIDAGLDSGAQRSLFNGEIGRVLGLDLFSGREVAYVSTTGVSVIARMHPVSLSHPALGRFRLEVGFSTTHIRRNLLGRDLFNLIQIGFRERHLTFYVTPTP